MDDSALKKISHCPGACRRITLTKWNAVANPPGER